MTFNPDPDEYTAQVTIAIGNVTLVSSREVAAPTAEQALERIREQLAQAYPAPEYTVTIGAAYRVGLMQG